MDNPYGWLQDTIDQVPEFIQPLIVALAGAVPYVEGEGAAAFGILAGLDPVVAAIAGAAGNILCVVLVVLLGSRVREGVLSRRAAATARRDGTGGHVDAAGTDTTAARAEENSAVLVAEAPAGSEAPGGAESEPSSKGGKGGKGSRRTKGRQRLRRWLVRFGVPGASLLAPLALPTMLTAAFFVGSGVPKQWVILWQVVAILVWTTLVALAATGALALLGW
jgi:hypothetical protein